MPAKDAFFQQHISRLKSRLSPDQKISSIVDVITKRTMLAGKPFSFERFRYQQHILEHPAAEKIIQKPAQTGLTELSMREAVAFCLLLPNINVIYTLPTAGFAANVAATRLNPLIDSSPEVAAAIHRDTDSTSIKRFTNDSFIFMRGASSTSQTISIPATVVVCDEYNFCEEAIVTAYTSRLQAATNPQQRIFSTPTVGTLGVSALMQSARRFIPIHRCDRCGHRFRVDYYKHVRIPEFKGHLSEFNFLTKGLLLKYDVNLAYVECEKCKRPMFLDDWEFVLENPDENYDAHGWAVSPFIVSKVRPPSALIKDATKYRSVVDFTNNVLGLPSEDSSTGLQKDEVEALFTQDVRYPDNPAYQVCGFDLGGVNHLMCAYPAPDGVLRVTHVEKIPLSKMRERVPKIHGEHRIISSVADSQPFIDLILQLQETIYCLYACLFSSAQGLELYTLKSQEGDDEKAMFGVRQITCKRDAMLDFLANTVRAGRVSFAPSTFHLQGEIVKHLTDLRRVKVINRQDEEEYRWKKSASGADHWAFALLYLILASQIKGYGGGGIQMPMIAARMKVKQQI